MKYKENLKIKNIKNTKDLNKQTDKIYQCRVNFFSSKNDSEQ